VNQTIRVYELPGNEQLATGLVQALNASRGVIRAREFPDGETYVRGETDCEDMAAVLVANLFQPNAKILPLLFFARALRELGARRVLLVSPYLPYMRQDIQFQSGEVITSEIFARLLSDTVDALVTVDPHLHRYSSLDEIYTIPSRVQHAAPSIAAWIREHVKQPVIVGPDSESEQWVSKVAEMAGAPFLVLEKVRSGDRDVKIKVPPLDSWRSHTPVLVDDIISTAHTMIETIGHLAGAGYAAPVCIGVHAVFAGNAYKELQQAGAARIVTCNTISHPSNEIDLVPALGQAVLALLNEAEKLK
jgi:ribose-phosphate pyrophosphokinase